jgi:dihydrolipoamide dehydrogenase
MAMADKFDCVVIGSGPGGYVGAIRAAQLGMKTAVVEKENVGGRCLNEACIPAKAMLRVAEVLDEVSHAKQFGISVNGREFDWSGAAKHRDRVIKTLTDGVGLLFRKNKIEVVEGRGSLTSAANVRTLALVEVLFAQAVSRRVFGQRVSAREGAGMALVVAGVALLLFTH